MSDVPLELWREILLRLPAEPLLRFRTVCKEWRGVIDDPFFVRAHINNQLSSTTLLIRNETGAPLFSFCLESLQFTDDRQTIRATPVKQPIRRGTARLRALPVASCNGLMLLSHHDIKKTWAIWNPLTRECRDLPQPDAEFHLTGCGIGYDYAADDYKVVRIDSFCRGGVFSHQTHVYSLKLDSWRTIDDDYPSEYACLRSPGVFLNGALHWSSRDNIIALDLATEHYRQLTLPPLPSIYGIFNIRLDGLCGCLVLSYYDGTLRSFDGWVMKDYGVGDSWMKLYSFDEQNVNPARRLRPVAYFKSKTQVFLQYDGGFFWYDIASDSVKKVTIQCFPRISSSQICPGSLFRLNDTRDVGGRVAAKRKRKRKKQRAETRLTFCVGDTGD